MRISETEKQQYINIIYYYIVILIVYTFRKNDRPP